MDARYQITERNDPDKPSMDDRRAGILARRSGVYDLRDMRHDLDLGGKVIVTSSNLKDLRRYQGQKNTADMLAFT